MGISRDIADIYTLVTLLHSARKINDLFHTRLQLDQSRLLEAYFQADSLLMNGAKPLVAMKALFEELGYFLHAIYPVFRIDGNVFIMISEKCINMRTKILNFDNPPPPYSASIRQNVPVQ